MREQLIQEKQTFHIEQIKHHEAKQQAMKLEQQKNHLMQMQQQTQKSLQEGQKEGPKDGPASLPRGPSAMEIDEDTNQSAVSMPSYSGASTVSPMPPKNNAPPEEPTERTSSAEVRSSQNTPEIP